MIRITQDMALTLVDHAVEQKGEDHKAKCVYFHTNGTPACIVGNVLHQVGITGKDFRAVKLALKKADDDDWTDMDSDITTAARIWRDNKLVDITPSAIRVLSAAQSVQDGLGGDDEDRGTWGAAKKAAHDEQEFRPE